MTDQDIPRCTATNSAGQPCRNRPIRGGTVCSTHGGSAPQVRAAAAARRLEARIAGEVQAAGWEPITDPLAAYSDLAGEVWAFKELARAQVNELQSWELTIGSFSGDEGDAFYAMAEQAKALVQVYERALDRCDRQLSSMLRLGLDAQALRQSRERPTREQAEQLVTVMNRVLDALDLTPEQRGRVPSVIAAEIAGMAAA